MKKNNEFNGYIYLLIDKRNGLKYIGKHNGKKKYYITGGLIPNRIIKKHGNDIFEREILEENIKNLKILNEREKFYIEKYNTFNDGYNLSIGGDGGGDWILKKTKEEIEAIAKIKSDKNKGRIFSEETKELMSLKKKGIPLTEEHKLNIRKAQSGENHPWFNKKHSEESKLKMSKSRIGFKNIVLSKRLQEYNANSKKISINGEIYKSQIEASQILKIARETIRKRVLSEKHPNYFYIKNN